MMATSFGVRLARRIFELVVCPTEYHGIGTPSYKTDLHERFLAWFGEHVKDVEASAITGS